ncbi:uncharacterized protein VTP21DRAFT_1848 [Calcarisporiella thermophila]|uniref:uncharacterized protein n=1 Tax=Calcarisporiella thermophila TaxID=911321 RepID=UPI0037426845
MEDRANLSRHLTETRRGKLYRRYQLSFGNSPVSQGVFGEHWKDDSSMARLSHGALSPMHVKYFNALLKRRGWLGICLGQKAGDCGANRVNSDSSEGKKNYL